MKRPSFQFYPADWSANSNLRRCTHEEKGIWIDVMCLLHDQEEYGVARWSLKEIAQAIGCSLAKLRGLVTKGVIKGADAGITSEPLIYIPRSGRKEGPAVTLIDAQSGPIWFSSRMVIDEYKRVLRGEYGSSPKVAPDKSPKGGIGAAPKAAPNQSPFTCAPGQAPRAAPSSSSSSSPSVNPEAIASGVDLTVVEPENENRLAQKTEPDLSATARVCIGLKAMGYSDTNPHDPKLSALIDAGLTPDEILAAGHSGKGKAKGFRWVLATAEGRRRDAANVAPLPDATKEAPGAGRLSLAGQQTQAAAERLLRSMEGQP